MSRSLSRGLARLTRQGKQGSRAIREQSQQCRCERTHVQFCWVLCSIKDAIQKDKEAAKKPESKSLILSETLLSKDALGIELPEFMTAKLMEKWESLTTFERVLFFQKTPVDKIDHVIVGKKDGKNLTAPYVKGNYMFKEANAAFLYDWYISDVVITVGIKGVSAVGTLYAWFKEYNKYLQRPATGYQELNGQVDAELARKGAITDAIKKGLSLFGFNSDVYSGERD